MKRLILLLPLLLLVIWLAAGKSGKVKPLTVASSAVVAAPAAPLSDPCNPCDPDGSLEAGCVVSGGIWNSNNCNCTYLTCDPTGILEANCFFSGGTWNPDFCHCDIPACNPSPPGHLQARRADEGLGVGRRRDRPERRAALSASLAHLD